MMRIVNVSNEPKSPEYRCTDRCGAVSLDPNTQGWTQLQITGRWRCGACVRALIAVQHLIGPDAPETFVDLVEPTSRGALPKETASSISAPSLKG